MKKRMVNLSIMVLISSLIFIFMSQLTSRAKPSSQPSLNKSDEIIAQKSQFVSDEIIVKLKPAAHELVSLDFDAGDNVVTGLVSLDNLSKKHKVYKMKQILRGIGRNPKRKLSPKAEQLRQGLRRLYKLKLKQGVDVLEAVSEYQEDPNVEYAQPNYIYQTSSTFPNDPGFGNLWGLHNTGAQGATSDADIDAPEAWDVNTGGTDVVVAVIDTGVDYTHEDLAGNMWVNPGEIADNGIDDDGNGYVDDIYGIDACNSDSDPFDDQGHGTHCSGIIGAVGNNAIGVVGVNWNVKIMALKFLSSGGSGTDTDAVTCLDYAVANGAHITSNSWGGGGNSQVLKDAIEVANSAGVLFVSSAGNNSQDIDMTPYYPARFDNENIIVVAATDNKDNLAYFSNYGTNTVDVAAPGVDIYSTLPPNAYLTSSCNDSDGDGYDSCSGTSMSCPYVAGLAALVWTEFGLGSLDHLEVKSRVIFASDPLQSLAGKVLTDGRINAYKALTFVEPLISYFSPGYGPEGLPVTIMGLNFGDTQGSGYVDFNGISAPITSWSRMKITCTVPVGATTGEVTVVSDSGVSNSKPFTVCSYNTYYRDADGDGYGDPNNTVQDCYMPEGYLTDNSDCLDSNLSVYPGAPEICNGLDSDCNGTVDDNCIPCTTIYVPDHFSSIQAAIEAATDGCEIVVRDGTYTQNINFKDKAVLLRSENGAGFTTLDGGGNGSVVSFDTGRYAASVLDGFTITGGSGTVTSGTQTSGGGIFVWESSPTIKNCIIVNNTATAGGGILIKNNSYSYNPIVTNCTISDNTALFTGGIYCVGASAKIDKCIISGNTGSNGAGVALATYDSALITNTFITGNMCTENSMGGGIKISYYSTPTIINSVISGNNAAGGFGKGGAIACIINSTPTFINSIIWDNSDKTNQVMYLENSTLSISYSDVDGGWAGEGNIDITPSFVSHKRPTRAPTSDSDYHLKSDSSCIDAGTDDAVTYPDLPVDDIDGDSRPLGTSYDMGADEYQSDGGPVEICDNGTDDDGDGDIDCADSDCIGDPACGSGCVPVPEICDDGIDNDCDGKADCADRKDCRTDPAC